VQDQVTRAIEGNAPCRDDETPEVEPAALLEAAEDVGVEFEDIVEGDTYEDCDYDGNAAALGVDFGHVERRSISWRGLTWVEKIICRDKEGQRSDKKRKREKIKKPLLAGGLWS
jgi:hypothetical protein